MLHGKPLPPRTRCPTLFTCARRPDMPGDGQSGKIVTTTRDAGAAARLLGPQAPFLLEPEPEQGAEAEQAASAQQQKVCPARQC